MWATLVVYKKRGGRGLIVNSSQRGLFNFGDRYYNHQLKFIPDGSIVNVVVKLSPKGRRMIKELRIRA
jgi:hypothetical protein